SSNMPLGVPTAGVIPRMNFSPDGRPGQSTVKGVHTAPTGQVPPLLDGLTDPRGSPLPAGATYGQPPGEGEGDGEADGDGDGDGDSVGEGDSVGDGEGDSVGDGEGDSVGKGDGLGDSDGEGDGVGDGGSAIASSAAAMAVRPASVDTTRVPVPMAAALLAIAL